MKYFRGSLFILFFSSLALFGFRPFSDDSEALVEALESNFQAYFQVELYDLVQFEKGGEVRRSQAFLIYSYGQDSARGIWRILPSESFPAATLLSLQGPDFKPPQLYLRAEGSSSGVWMTGEDKRQPFGSTAWYLEDIYDDDKENWNNTRGNPTYVNRIYCNQINQSYGDPTLRRESLYSRRTVFLSMQDNLFIQSDFYDRSDRLLKRLLGSNHQNLGSEAKPRIRALRLVMDHFVRDVLTVMTLTHFNYDLELESGFFSPDNIDQWDAGTDQSLKAKLTPVSP